MSRARDRSSTARAREPLLCLAWSDSSTQQSLSSAQRRSGSPVFSRRLRALDRAQRIVLALIGGRVSGIVRRDVLRDDLLKVFGDMRAFERNGAHAIDENRRHGIFA